MSDDRKGPNLAALGASIKSAYDAAGVQMLRIQIHNFAREVEDYEQKVAEKKANLAKLQKQSRERVARFKKELEGRSWLRRWWRR